jgi:hypothetical protein
MNSPSGSFTPRQFTPRVAGQTHVFHSQIVTTLPPNHRVIFHNGTRFFFAHGHFFRVRGAHFVTVFPPVGIVVPFVPVFATAVWFGGYPYPYYYADGVYYTPVPGGYAVAPPPADAPTITEEPAGTTGGASMSGDGVTEQPAYPAYSVPPADSSADVGSTSTAQAPSDGVFIYPRQDQSPQQQQSDRSECRTWASGQTGYDPQTGAGDSRAINFTRALSACLEGRGYTVR